MANNNRHGEDIDYTDRSGNHYDEQHNIDLGDIGTNPRSVTPDGFNPNLFGGSPSFSRGTGSLDTSLDYWLELWEKRANSASDANFQNEYLSAASALASEQRQRDWALADREHQEQYDDPSQQLARLMATGMSRQAAMQALSAGATAMPTNPNGSAASPFGGAASAAAQRQANVLSGIGTAASFIPYIGQVASAGCQVAAQQIVSNVESQYNGLVNAGYTLPKEFSGSPERQKQFLAACAGQGSDFPDWIASWLNDESNAEAREACAKIFNSKSYQRLLTGGGFITRAARQLYRETFKDWISTRGFNAIETDADLKRKMLQQQFLANNLQNIVSYTDALTAGLESFSLEVLGSLTIGSPQQLVSDVITGSPTASGFLERAAVNGWINPETGKLTEDAPILMQQYFASVATSAQYAIMSADPDLIESFFAKLKSDNRSKQALATLQESINSQSTDAFRKSPDWFKAALGFISLLNVSGVSATGKDLLEFVKPSVRRTRGVVGGNPVNTTTINF